MTDPSANRPSPILPSEVTQDATKHAHWLDLDALGDPSPTQATRFPGDPAAPTATRPLPPSPSLPMPTLPGYEILGVLGRGGMGVVYLARHLALQRQVALKMILAGVHAGPDDLSRFRTEVQAVAQLQHPNIVQVYEVGDHQGMPFCTLEYVDGDNLGTLIQGKPQPPHEGARLVAQLARAVQAAHEKGIVHRDLKPANILLAVSDQRSAISQTKSSKKLIADSCMLTAIPKITDFGLAKRLTERSSHTRTGEVVGTPSYMSPEQAAGQPEEIGPATDIYALGAILYELLTGRPPFLGVTPVDTIMMVNCNDPVPPSQSQPLTPRDVETICLKCLEKQPQKRYLSATELADDLERFLRNEPIRARRSTIWEHTGKWVRRRPAVAALLAALVVTVVASFLGMSWLYWQAQQERDEALRQKQRADENLDHARRAVHQHLTLVTREPRLREGDFLTLRKDLLETALPFLEEFARQKSDDPQVQVEQAQSLLLLGNVRNALDEADKAIAAAADASRIFARLMQAQPAVATHWEGHVDALFMRAHALEALNRPQEAELGYRDCLKKHDEMLQHFPDSPRHQNQRANYLNNLGNTLERQGRLPEAEAAHRETLRLREQVLAVVPGDPDSLSSLGGALHNLAMVRLAQGTPGEACTLLEQALVHQQAAVKLRPQQAGSREFLGHHFELLADSYQMLGRREEAIQALRAGLDCRLKLVNDFPTVLSYRRRCALVATGLARRLEERGIAGQEEAWRVAVTHWGYLAERRPQDATAHSELGANLHNLANLPERRHRSEENLALFRQALKHQQMARRLDPSQVAYREKERNHHTGIAIMLNDLRRWAEALPHLKEAIALCSAEEAWQWQVMQALCWAHTGKHEQAVAAARKLNHRKEAQPLVFLDLARVFALAARNAKADDPRREPLVQDALRVLRQVQSKGLFDSQPQWNAFQRSPDWDGLRSHPDFKKWVLEVESGQP